MCNFAKGSKDNNKLNRAQEMCIMSIFGNLFGGKKTDEEVLMELSQLENDSNCIG